MYNMHVHVLSRYLQIKINVIRGYMHVCPLHITIPNNYTYLHRACSFITAENIEFIMNCYLSLKLLQIIFAKNK